MNKLAYYKGYMEKSSLDRHTYMRAADQALDNLREIPMFGGTNTGIRRDKAAGRFQALYNKADKLLQQERKNVADVTSKGTGFISKLIKRIKGR